MLTPTDARWTDAFARDFAAALRRRSRGPSAQSCRSRSRKAAAIPAYLAEFRLTKGRCLARKCSSRWAVTRVSIDLRDRSRVDRVATLECAACGHVWRRVTPPRLTEYQSTRLTLILPGDEHRWYARGRWHREGEDAVTLPDASQAELMGAMGDWRKRNEHLLAAKARLADKKRASETALLAHTTDLLTRLAQLDDDRRADEAAATERE